MGFAARKEDSDLAHGVDRGITSHCRAQAAGLAEFLAGARNAGSQHVWSCSVYDDASMWVQNAGILQQTQSPNDPAFRRLHNQHTCNRPSKGSLCQTNAK